MQFVVVTGMSGAGKSLALKYLEDIGFFCVDNLPPSLMSKFAEVCFRPGSDIERVAMGIDIRGGRLFEDLFEGLSDLNREDYQYKILFLDASDPVLLQRYKESRRSHPLAKNDRVITGIEKERGLLKQVKERADYIIDTSHTLTRHLKQTINDIFLNNKDFDSLMITVLSFGFKYGIPSDADLVFDVRFLPNPFYVPELKEQTGNDLPVKEFVMGLPDSTLFMDKLLDMLQFLIPLYVKEGKNQLVIGIGCTGGKHRSVTMANELYYALQRAGNHATINHRDIDKDSRLAL